MRYAIRLAALFCSVIAGLQMVPASAKKRVALVIGNGSYLHIAHLPNVANDAAAMAALFRTAKLDAVDVRHNLGVVELRRALRDFAGQAADADVAVLFYAGHGIEVGQVNYLIPVDARLVTDFDAEDETVSLDRVLQAMEPAKRLRLVILDACRENPFVKSMKRTVAARSVGRGLGRVEPSISNTLIAYATRPNAIAEDGRGPNSPFTAALVKHLLTPGLDLRIALGRVRDEVLASTASKQEPYVTGSLGGVIVSIVGDAHKPDAPSMAPPVPTLMSDAARAWSAAKDSTDIAALEAFRRQYGASNAFYDRLAETRIEELKKRQVAMVKAEWDRQRAEEEKQRADAAAKKKADEDARAKAEAERRRIDLLKQEEERKRIEAAAAKQAAEAAKKKAGDEARLEAAAAKQRAEEEARAKQAAEKAADHKRLKREKERKQGAEETKIAALPNNIEKPAGSGSFAGSWTITWHGSNCTPSSGSYTIRIEGSFVDEAGSALTSSGRVRWQKVIGPTKSGYGQHFWQFLGGCAAIPALVGSATLVGARARDAVARGRRSETSFTLHLISFHPPRRCDFGAYGWDREFFGYARPGDTRAAGKRERATKWACR
jgi:uncharacterized caspase-like protein